MGKKLVEIFDSQRFGAAWRFGALAVSLLWIIVGEQKDWEELLDSIKLKEKEG